MAAQKLGMASASMPDLGAPRRLALTIVAVTALVCVLLLLQGWPSLGATLGDSDDALRLQRVRDLLAGEPWFDHRVDRIQPPEGGVIHWSRLLDGVLAAMVSLFDAVASRAQAEQWTRVAWPLLWVGPTVAGALITARTLGGGRAVALCAVLMAPSMLAFVQFLPGRIDHHNIQIALAVTGLAGAVAGGRRGGLVSAVSAAVGLAIGVEALVFHALIGGAFALRWAFDPRAAGAATTYGLVLPLLLAGLYAIQTPPSGWAIAACDVAGSNLLAAVGLGAFGLAAAARGLSGSPATVRFGALGLLGVVAASVYAAMEPACLGGPLGAADPRLGPVWLEHVEEVQTLAQNLASEPAEALAFLAPPLAGLLALIGALFSPRVRRDPAWLTAGAFLLLAVVAQAAASRMIFYAVWAGLPIIAAAVVIAADRFWSGRLLPSMVAVLLLSPFVTVLSVGFAAERLIGAKPEPQGGASANAACYSSSAYQELARLPTGRVLSTVYLGSHIVALTPHSAISAPYHRMDRGILEGSAALEGPLSASEARVRALGARYVITCPAMRRRGQPGADLRSLLDHGAPPPWLEQRSAQGAALNIYEVRPAA